MGWSIKKELGWVLVVASVLAAVPGLCEAQWKAKDTEWPSYAADLAGTRYRPLDQINAANFNDLEIAWRIKTDNFGNRPEYKLEGTPLMVNGVLYATAGSRRANCCGFTGNMYVVTGGTGEMIVGGKIANRQNLRDKDGIIPGEYRGQPIEGGQTYKVKAGDWLLIPPDTPHQPKPDAGGFSYMIMKINVGIYPWNLVR